MFSVSLDHLLVIDRQDTLRELFQCDCVFLSYDATLKLIGIITLQPNVIFSGTNVLTGPVTIETGSVLENTHFGPHSRVRSHSVLTNLVAGAGNLFGPFCFIRDHCVVGDDVILGAHVEAARSHFGSGVKISHRAFVGDAKIGKRTIIGAGTVFCNYNDGERYPVSVGEDVVIGSGTMLVAPLSIGDNAIIGAGSVISKNVPAGEKIVQKR